MRSYAIIEAPSVLGLFPSGLEHLPRSLMRAGLDSVPGTRWALRVEPPPYRSERDSATGLLNSDGLRDFAIRLANATGEILEGGEFPLVLGGDCSILLGPMLALRRRGRYGLLFIDAHADFYQPEAEPNGEAASMDLALVTGHGPDIVTDIQGLGPLVQEADVVHLGRRDAEEAEEAGSQRIEDTEIHVIDLAAIRRHGPRRAVGDAMQVLTRVDGFWIHLDCDVIDDELMPAVDYRLPGGLSWDELAAVLRAATSHPKAVGLEVTIFNPTLDDDGSLATALVETLRASLASHRT